MELQATKTSVITVSRTSSVELSKAIRKIFLKLTEKFIITDIEYAIDYDSDEKENIYSAMILGYLSTGGIIDLSERDTQFPDGIELDIQSEEGAPSSAVVGNSLRVATIDNNGLMSKTDKQVLNQLVLDLTEAKSNITVLEDDISNLQERVTALENKEDKDTVYDDSEIRDSLESLRILLTNVQTASDDSDLELTTDITNLRSELELLKTKNISDNETLVSSISRLESTIEQLESAESHLSDISTLINRIELLETEDESVKESLTSLSSALTNLQNSYNSSTESNLAIIESIQTDIDTLKAKPDYDDSEIKESIESIENSLLTLNNYDDSEIRQTITNLQSVVDTLSHKEDKDTVYDDSEIKESIESIQSTLSSINDQKENNTLYNDEEVKESIQTLETSLLALSNKETTDIADVNSLITGLNSTIESIQTALNSDIKENEEALELIQEELAGLKQKDSSIDSTIESIQTSITVLSGNLTSNSDAITSVRNSVSTLEEKVDTTDEEIKGIIAQINEAIEALENKEDRDTIYDDSAIRDVISEINSAITELQNKEDKDTVYDDSQLTARMTTVESNIEELQQSVDTLTRDKLSSSDLYISEELKEGEESELDTIKTEIPIVDNIKLIDSSLKSIKTRITELENKEDKDTVYDDSAIQEAIATINSTLSILQNKEDKDTVYDDEEIRGFISTLQGAVAVLENKEDKDTVYDDSEIQNSLSAIDLAVKELQSKPDYDDSEIKENIADIESKLSNLRNYDDSNITARITAIENSIKLPILEEGQSFNYLIKEMSVGTNLNILDSTVKSLADRLAIEEAKEDKDSIYDDENILNTISSIQTTLESLQNKEDKDTVYNDEEIRGLINTLQASVTLLQGREDKDTVYDDSEVQSSINAINLAIDELKAKPDYDDSEIKSDIESLESSLANLNNYDDSAISARVSVIENSLMIADNQSYSIINKNNSVGTNLGSIDVSIKNISDRLSEVENRTDIDTVYDDSEIKSDIQTINSTLANLSNYDDSSVVNRISSIEEAISIPEPGTEEEPDKAYSVINISNSVGENLAEIDSKLEELFNRTDNDTLYDDSALKIRIKAIEDDLIIPEPEQGTIYKAINSEVSIGDNILSLNNFVDNSDRVLTTLINKTGELENKIKIPELLNGDYDFVDTSKTVGENLAIIDTKISEVNDSLDSKLDSSKLIDKNGYFNAVKERTNGNQTIIRDEETGGGIFAITKNYKPNQINGIRSFVGVNLGDSSVPVFGQIYAVDLDNGNNGVRVNWNDNRMCYITGNTDSSKIGEERWLPEDREIAVKGDLTDYVPKAKYNALVNLLISKGLVTQEDIDALDS